MCYYSNIFNAVIILDNHQDLKKVKVPALFTTGEFDEARPETVKRFCKMIPHSKFALIPDAGHATLNDNGPALSTAIQKFIAAQEK